ncbi:hypothetical protein [Dysosmobacter sp.]|uniref:hypothetical protein n=1 Tax=Dysosmobacter sp. TaxID=2591382 RepID=UPI002A9D1770|nr:hypothetical protein [Dysosmobacter sp.]MDY5613513.1 hypothetical protein [Dysosmobacter sp.]
MANEAQTSPKMADPAIRKSIDAWERRRRLRYVLVPVGILLLIIGLTLRHTIPGKIMAVLGVIIIGMYRSGGSRCPVCGHYNYTLKGREYHCRLCGFHHYDI